TCVIGASVLPFQPAPAHRAGDVLLSSVAESPPNTRQSAFVLHSWSAPPGGHREHCDASAVGIHFISPSAESVLETTGQPLVLPVTVQLPFLHDPEQQSASPPHELPPVAHDTETSGGTDCRSKTSRGSQIRSSNPDGGEPPVA